MIDPVAEDFTVEMMHEPIVLAEEIMGILKSVNEHTAKSALDIATLLLQRKSNCLKDISVERLHEDWRSVYMANK